MTDENNNNKRIFVNNKPVLMPVEWNIKEGWVKALVPIVPTINPEVESIQVDEEFDYKEILLEGKVEEK